MMMATVPPHALTVMPNDLLSRARDTARRPKPLQADHSRFLASARTEVIALGKRRKGGSDHESVKPINGIQPVQVRPGQSRSGQAGSACCHSPGDWRMRSVHSEEAGREDSAPTSVHFAMPTLLTKRKAASARPILRGWRGVAGVPSPGHAFKWIPCEPRRAPCLSRMMGVVCRPTQRAPGLWSTRVAPGKRTYPQREKPAVKGNRGGSYG